MSEINFTRSSSQSKRDRYLGLIDDEAEVSERLHGRPVGKLRKHPTICKSDRRIQPRVITHRYPILVDANVFGWAHSNGRRDCRQTLELVEAGVFKLCKTSPIEVEIMHLLAKNPEVSKSFSMDKDGLSLALVF